MDFGSHCVTSRRWRFSTEESKEYLDNYYHDIDVEKIIPGWFYLVYSDECEKHREFTNNVCSYHFIQKVPLLSKECGILYIEQNSSYEFNPTCSHDCYVKYNSITCIDCQNIFLKTNINPRCSSCYLIIKQKLQKYNPKELEKLANSCKKRRKKEFTLSELLQTNRPFL